jgi:hypothetical protein
MYPIRNITTASKPIELVIRDSIEALCRNFGKIAIAPIIAPVPKDPNSNPKPVESSLNSCLAKSGKRDNNALLHIVKRPARTIKTCAA